MLCATPAQHSSTDSRSTDSKDGGRGNSEREAGSPNVTRAVSTASSSEDGLPPNRRMTFVEGKPKPEPIHLVIPSHYHVPRKVVVKSLEILDAQDSPERPGMMFESTLKDMVTRFDSVFGTPQKNGQKLACVIDHLRRHTRRRRGDAVLQEGYLEWEQTSRVYEVFCTELNTCERIFFTVDVGESSSILSKACSFFLIFMIFISITMWMVSTLPSVMEIPKSSEGVNCAISTKVGECAPEPHELFKYIEHICVITFTVEYVVRLMTVHSVRFALLDEYFMEAVLTGRPRTEADDDEPIEDTGNNYLPKLDGKLKTMFTHVTASSNVIDLLAILPYWLEIAGVRGGGGFLVVLRILRLTRIFRVFKLGKYNDVFTLFTRVINQSVPALLLMLFFICLGCCLFGTLVWFAEQGEWHPAGNPVLLSLSSPITGRGAFLRHTGSKDALELEESPFQSIIHSFWYVIVTITTVGYGDIFPTTPEGKVVAAVAILNGIIVLAMPIGVVGANFSTEYYKVIEDKKRRQRMKNQLDTQAILEEQEDAALIGGATLVEQESDTRPDETATELLRIDVARSLILGEAEALDKSFQLVLPEVMHRELSENLRFFVSSFIIGSDAAFAAPESSVGFIAKPKVQMARLLDLDALSTHVHTAVATMTSEDELSDFGLVEALDCRRKWDHFSDRCWEYATTMCLIEKHHDPPEYFQMKARLATKVAPRKTINDGGSAAKLAGRAILQDGKCPPAIGSMPSGDGAAVGAASSGRAPGPCPPPQPPLISSSEEAGPPESSVPEVTGPEPPEQPPTSLPGIPSVGIGQSEDS